MELSDVQILTRELQTIRKQMLHRKTRFEGSRRHHYTKERRSKFRKQYLKFESKVKTIEVKLILIGAAHG